MFRFQPSMESLEVRETPSATGGSLVVGIPGEDVSFQTEQTRQTSVVVDLSTDGPDATTPSGSVRFVVDGVQVDATADGRKYKMLVAPLILDTDAEAVRHRMFAIVDRTQVAETEASEAFTIGGPQVERGGSVYTITFGGSLVGAASGTFKLTFNGSS